MKVLYIGVYRDGTGWGQAALDTILALDTAGVDIVVRPVKLNDYKAKIPDRVEELEAKTSIGSDVVIQHILPHMMDYSGRFAKNIGYYCSETSNFRMSNWPERLNMMDEGWVANHQMLYAARNSHVTIPLNIAHYATNIEKFHRSYEPLDFVSKLQDRFIFYTIGELTRRKNLPGLLKAFYSEFDTSEPISLVIKAHKPGMSSDETKKHVIGMCNEIKNGLKLYPRLGDYNDPLIITDRLTDEALSRLHTSCDCFVQPSFGEAWSIPAFEAMAFGKTPIVTNWGGFTEYMTENTGWLLRYQDEVVFGINDSFNDLFTGHESWAAVPIPSIKRAMREAYENKELREQKALAGREQAYNFSYEKVGNKLRQLLSQSGGENGQGRREYLFKEVET